MTAALEGGVYLNVGSAVILPEIFLKAVTLARNLGHALENITTVNLDFNRHYRPMTNVVKRPTARGGTDPRMTPSTASDSRIGCARRASTAR